MIEQLLLAAFVFHAVIRPAPDALEIVDFAFAVARSAAGAIALVLRALRFRAEKRNVRQRAIAAILAAEHRGFARMFQNPQRPRALRRIFRGGVDLFVRACSARARA